MVIGDDGEATSIPEEPADELDLPEADEFGEDHPEPDSRATPDAPVS